MEKTSLKAVKSLSKIAIAVTKANINSTCFGPGFQPKVPDGFKKLQEY